MRLRQILALVLALAAPAVFAQDKVTTKSWPVPKGSGPHDVAADPKPGGLVYYTAQRQGALGLLDPATGNVEQIPLGQGSAPHGVIVGPDGAPWITDSGLNAIVRVDMATKAIKTWALPTSTGYANLNTATFDRKGVLWFTGQSGYHGRLDPASGKLDVWNSPLGRGPYGIATTPSGEVYYASLAGSHIAKINLETGEATVIKPPTEGQGARRVWADSKNFVWVSEWNSGQVSRYDPATASWRVWKLPGEKPRTYSVYVDETDKVWLTDWGANAMLRFDPAKESFEIFPHERRGANVRQMLGRKGEAWAPESAHDIITVYMFGGA